MSLREFFRSRSYVYFFSGSISVSIFELILTIYLTETFNIWYLYSYSLSLLVGLILLYLFHASITFNRSKENLFKDFFKFFILYLNSFVMSIFFVFLTTKVGLHYMYSVILISALLSIFNYKMNKRWVFAKNA